MSESILDKVGSYGKQIGRIGDALDVILKHVKLENLTPDEQDALNILKGQIAEVRQAKAGHPASARLGVSGETQTPPP